MSGRSASKASKVIMLVVVILMISINVQAGYRKELRHATARGGMYDLKTGNAKLLWTATLFTNEYRRAFAEKHIEIEYLNPVDAGIYMGQQESEQAREWEVIVSMYTPKDYKKFSMGKDSFWETFLTTEYDESVWPISIEEIKITPYWKVMYPFLERWAKLYRVTFPKVAIGKKATITMRSVVGDDHIGWNIRTTSE